MQGIGLLDLPTDVYAQTVPFFIVDLHTSLDCMTLDYTENRKPLSLSFSMFSRIYLLAIRKVDNIE